MLKIVSLCIATSMVAIGIVVAYPGGLRCEPAADAMHQVAAPDRPDGLTVLSLLLAALVPTFVVSQLLLLLVGPNLALAHGASFLITGSAAGTIFTSDSGFAGPEALALVAAPQLFWLLIDLIRAERNR